MGRTGIRGKWLKDNFLKKGVHILYIGALKISPYTMVSIDSCIGGTTMTGQHEHHSHEHVHHHNHGNYSHHHHHNANKKALAISFILIFTFMIAEVLGGIWTNSLALLSDAGHMLSDAAALGLSLFAFKFSERAANYSKTYGYKRFEILAAFINGFTLIIIAFFIYWEAIERFRVPPDVSSQMLWIALLGLMINLLVAWILMKGDTEENLNMRGAFLHVLGDLLGSVGAIIAGVLILLLDWNMADPIASIIVATLVMISGWRVLKDSFHILMEGTPTGIDSKQVRETLMSTEGVCDVHDLHIWTITSGFPALSCHVVVEEGTDRDVLLLQLQKQVCNIYHIKHSTFQIEGDTIESNTFHEKCH